MRRISGPNASLSRCAMPAVGSSRQSTRAPDAMRQASSTMRRVPVESSLTNRSTNAPSPRNAMTSSASRARDALPRSDAGHGEADRLAHGQVGEQLGALERPAEPEPGPPRRREPVHVAAEDLDPTRGCGTKPPIAFISVDLPAPFAPMSPTTSPRSTSRSTSSTTTRGPNAPSGPRPGSRRRGRREPARRRRWQAPGSVGAGSTRRDSGIGDRRRQEREHGVARRCRAPARARRGSRGAGSAARRRW